MTRRGKDPYPFELTIAAQIRTSQAQRGLSDIRLAKLAGISRRHFAEVKKGANVTLQIAFKAMAALGLTRLTHEFNGRTVSLNLTCAPAALDVATRRDAEEQLEAAIESLTVCLAALRSAGAAGEPPPAAAKRSRAARGAALVDEFLGQLNDLDPDAQVEVLQSLFKATVVPPSPSRTTAAERPATTRKRRAKTP